MRASSLTHLWTGANKMIYFTFFHSLFWQNTMKKKGGITVFILQWAKMFNHAKELHHTCAKAKEISSVYLLFLWPPSFIEKESRAENSKEGHRYYSHLEHGPRLDIPDNKLRLTQNCLSGLSSALTKPWHNNSLSEKFLWALFPRWMWC